VLGDANGIPVALNIAGANVHDMKLVEGTLENTVAFRPIPTPEREHNLSMDKGYDYEVTNALVRQYGYTPHIRHRGEDALAYQKPGHPARRWVIERTNSWMNRFRRILIRWEKKAENYVAMLEFAFAVIVFKKMKEHNRLLG
jgi:putative transposase